MLYQTTPRHLKPKRIKEFFLKIKFSMARWPTLKHLSSSETPLPRNYSEWAWSEASFYYFTSYFRTSLPANTPLFRNCSEWALRRAPFNHSTSNSSIGQLRRESHCAGIALREHGAKLHFKLYEPFSMTDPDSPNSVLLYQLRRSSTS